MTTKKTGVGHLMQGGIYGYRPDIDAPGSYIGKIKKSKKSKYKKKFVDPDLFDSIDPARKALKHRLNKFLSGPMDKPLLVRTTPGLGKTEAAIAAAVPFLKKGLRVGYALPTRNMAHQVYQRAKGGVYGPFIDVVNLEGRHDGYTVSLENENTKQKEEKYIEPSCHNYDRVQKAAAKGYSPGAYVCPACPYFPSFKDGDGCKTGLAWTCKYYRSAYRAAGILGPQGKVCQKSCPKDGEEDQQQEPDKWGTFVVMTHQKFQSLASDGVQDPLVKFDIVFVDEDWTVALRDTISWSESELLRKVSTQKPIIDFRAVLRKTISIAKKYKDQITGVIKPSKVESVNTKVLRKAMKDSEIFHSYALHGSRLISFMKEAAIELGVDLLSTLESASLSDTGVLSGEYMTMSDAKDAMMPHSSEPAFAGELLKVVADCIGGKEKCYRASLRFDETRGWEYYLDTVRRMTYGGPVVFLDAYGDPDIVRRLCNDREPEVITVKVKLRNDVIVHHYYNQSTSRGTLDEQFDDVFDKYADPYLRSLANGKVVFYTQKRYEESLRNRLEEGMYGLERGDIKHYWQDRGDDSFKDYDVLFALGTPFSNIVAERHFANSLFYDEEPLDWSVDKKTMKYKDPRVAKHLQARQEKELQQACFRIRPASEAKKKQHIVIVSKMDIDDNETFNGAVIIPHADPPPKYYNDISVSMRRLLDYFGGWTPLFSAFILIEQRVIAWFEAGGVNSGREFPVSYDQMLELFKQWNGDPQHVSFVSQNVPFVLSREFEAAIYNGKKIRIAGDKQKVMAALDQIRLATREPGVDDEEPTTTVCCTSDIVPVVDELDEKFAQEIPEGSGAAEEESPRTFTVSVYGKTDEEVRQIALGIVIQDFKDRGLSDKIGAWTFMMEVEAIFGELQSEREFMDIFVGSKRKNPTIGEEAPDPPDDE